MDFLQKIEKAISEIENSKGTETSITLNYGELRGIRKSILLEKYETELATENLREGMKLRNRIKYLNM